MAYNRIAAELEKRQREARKQLHCLLIAYPVVGQVQRHQTLVVLQCFHVSKALQLVTCNEVDQVMLNVQQYCSRVVDNEQT